MNFKDLVSIMERSSFKSLDLELVFSDFKAISFVNPANFYSFLSFDRDAFDYVFSDGILLTKLLGKGYVRRSFDFTSLAIPFFQFAQRNQHTVLVVGGTEHEANYFVELVKTLVPGISLKGHTGYSHRSLYSDIQSLMNETRYVVLSVGHPLQDRLAIEICQNFPSVSVVTCGAFVHQTASARGFYYPHLVNRLNIRWAYRALYNRHVVKRLVFIYPCFLFKFLKDRSSNKSGD